MTVFMLTTYGWNTFSYSGIEVDDMELFKTLEQAEERAAELGLTVVEYVNDPDKEATIGEMRVR